MGLCCTELKFKLVEKLGEDEGQNSSVYMALDPQLNAELVVKQVLKKSIIEDYQSIDESNFYNESRILYDTKHPNIMEIRYASEDKDYIYYSMPFCKKGSLNALIDKRYLTVKEIIKYSLEFLSGLHYVHTKKLIHFDIKPTNIMIDNNNKAIVTDFGLAKYIDKYGLARPNKLYYKHTPPEAYSYGDFTNKSDIYQAGIVLYRMCNGNDNLKVQYDLWKSKGQLKQAIQKGIFPDRKFYLPHIPLKLRKIINKAMNVDVDERYETILDMINDISSIEENLNWVYNESKNKHSMNWNIINDKETHINRIELLKNKDKWDITGKKVRISDNNKSNINPWTFIGNNNLDEAFKKVQKIIKDYES